jgi:catechol 2,3-dioxygenase-like lactoylglutathione lyase family enzyme
MLDHVVVRVSDTPTSKSFYEAALAPLGISALREYPGSVGFGRDGKPAFWIRGGGGLDEVHIAFAAPDRPTVDAFYAAAVAAGGRDNGPPGVRLIYHPNYYGAFVHDPDGHNVEAVCHQAPD